MKQNGNEINNSNRQLPGGRGANSVSRYGGGSELSADDIIEATVVREFGQTLNYAAAEKISRYATDSNAECVAEAFADVYCNGSKAKAESRTVVSVLKKYI